MLQTCRVMVCKCFFFSRLTEPIFLLLYGLLIFVFSLWKSVEILRMGEGEVSKLIIIFNGKILTELEFSEGFDSYRGMDIFLSNIKTVEPSSRY